MVPLISFQTSTSGFSVCSSKGRQEEKATPTAAELFGECSFKNSVSRTQDAIQDAHADIVEPQNTDNELPSIKNDTDVADSQQVCKTSEDTRDYFILC